MTYLTVRHLNKMSKDLTRYFGAMADQAKKIIGEIESNRRDRVSWLALADLAEECDYPHIWDFRSRIAEYFE